MVEKITNGNVRLQFYDVNSFKKKIRKLRFNDIKSDNTFRIELIEIAENQLKL